MRFALSLAAQSCLTLCNPMDCSPPGSSVHGASPGKNTGVGCRALLQRKIPRNQTQVSCIAGRLFTTSKPLKTVNESESCSVVSDSSRPHGLYSPWNSPGQNTGMGSLSLLQGIFPTQGSNPGLPHCRQILYQLSHKGSPSHKGSDNYP